MAVKKMNLERVSMSLVGVLSGSRTSPQNSVVAAQDSVLLQDEIIREAQTMKSYNHPNVLPLYTSFVHGQDLWMVTPFMAGGSVLHIMKYQYPEVSSTSSVACKQQICACPASSSTKPHGILQGPNSAAL